MKELFPHNKFVYDKLKENLKKNQRACIIQPTGTGKSFISAEFLKDNPTKSFLLLTSSNYIIEQFNDKFQSLYSNYTYIAYQTLTSKAFNKLLVQNYDYIIIDEFHRLGAALWTLKIQELFTHYSNAKIIGMTATPIRYMQEERDLISEFFDGNLINNLSLIECFDIGILPRPKYISTLYNIDEEYKNLLEKINKSNNINKSQLKKRVIEYRAKWEYSHGVNVVLKKHISTERNFLIFCRDIQHLEQMLPIVTNWFKTFDSQINNFKVYSTYSYSKNELNEFKAASNRKNGSFNLLFSVQQLNEGLHVNNIEGVLFLRPTDSHIIYYQQLGRCLETKGKQPIVFDMVNNFNKSKIHTNFNNDTFKPIFKDNYLKTYYDDYKFSFNIIDEIQDTSNIFEHFHFNISTWYNRFLKIKSNLENNEPPKYLQLSKIDMYWFKYQRKNSDTLNKEQIKQLDSLENLLGFDWKKGYHKDVFEKINYIEYCHVNNILDKRSLITFLADTRKYYLSDPITEHKEKVILRMSKIIDPIIGYSWKTTQTNRIPFYEKYEIVYNKLINNKTLDSTDNIFLSGLTNTKRITHYSEDKKEKIKIILDLKKSIKSNKRQRKQ